MIAVLHCICYACFIIQMTCYNCCMFTFCKLQLIYKKSHQYSIIAYFMESGCFEYLYNSLKETSDLQVVISRLGISLFLKMFK